MTHPESAGAATRIAVMTLRDRPGRLTGEVKHCRWGHGRPSLPGPQPDPGGAPWPPRPRPQLSPPSSPCSPSQKGCPGWVPSRLHRLDPRGVRTGPAPVRQLVSAVPPASVRGPAARTHRARPRSGSSRPRPGHHHPAAHAGRPNDAAAGAGQLGRRGCDVRSHVVSESVGGGGQCSRPVPTLTCVCGSCLRVCGASGKSPRAPVPPRGHR